jgi:hypothetical protein
LVLADAVALEIIVVAVHRQRRVAVNRVREFVADLVFDLLSVVLRSPREDVFETSDELVAVAALILREPHHRQSDIVEFLSYWSCLKYNKIMFMLIL